MQSSSPPGGDATLPCRIPKKKFLQEMRLSTDAKSSGSDASSITDGLSPQMSDCSPLFSARVAANIIGSPDSNFLDKIQDMVSRGSGLDDGGHAAKALTAFSFEFVDEAVSSRPRCATNPAWSDKFVDLDFYNRTKDGGGENGGDKFNKLSAAFDDFGKELRQSELCKLEQFADVCSSQQTGPALKQHNTFQRPASCQPEDLTVTKSCDYTHPAQWHGSGPPYYCDMPPHPTQYNGGGMSQMAAHELQFDMVSGKTSGGMCVSPRYTQVPHIMSQGGNDFSHYLMDSTPQQRTFQRHHTDCSPTSPALHYPSSSHTVASPGGATWQTMTPQFSPGLQVSSTTPTPGGQPFSGATCTMKAEKDAGMMSTITTSGRNKGSGRTNEPKFECQVCGDVAAGFHCGAYVCEACKVSLTPCSRRHTPNTFISRFSNLYKFCLSNTN